MKSLLKWTVVLAVLIGAGAVAYPRMRSYWKSRNAPEFRTAEVIRDELIFVINATGTVQPKLRVQVGAVVSGPIVKLNVDYNHEVHKLPSEDEHWISRRIGSALLGWLGSSEASPQIRCIQVILRLMLVEAEKEAYVLAEIDPRIYEAAVARDNAALARAKAEVQRVEALLEQADNDYGRALHLQEEDPDYISGTEIDQYKYNYLALKAQRDMAKAARDQANANLENSEANLGYTKIYSPVDGIVIDRKIDKGQTLAAQFQTPVLFVVAPDMDKEMHVHASVDEADIGFVRKAKEDSQPVFFIVDAYPHDLFEGTIYQIRKNPTTTENVVTYPVVVSVPNPELKLLPGMTANLSFQIEKREKVLKVPNAAIRFYPEEKEYVREEDQKILEGVEEETDSEEEEGATDLRSAMQRILARKERDRCHVWVQDGERLRAVEITIGLSDYKYTELVSGDLEEGQELVSNVE